MDERKADFLKRRQWVLSLRVCLSYPVTSQLSALSPSCLCLHSYVLLELVETERDYVRDLGSVVEVRWKKIVFFMWRAVINSFSFHVFHTIFCSAPVRATCAGWKKRAFLTTWGEKIRSSLGISIRFMTGTKSMLILFGQLVLFKLHKKYLYCLLWYNSKWQKNNIGPEKCINCCFIVFSWESLRSV